MKERASRKVQDDRIRFLEEELSLALGACEKLRQEEARYRRLIDCAPVGIFEVDFATMRFLSVNEVMCHFLGYSREELLALRPEELLIEQSRRDFQARLPAIMAEGCLSEALPYGLMTRQGLEKWVLIVCRSVEGRDGAVQAEMIAIDITERRRVRDERVRLSTAMEQVAEGIVITDPGLEVLYVNPAYERLSVYSREDLIGRRLILFDDQEADREIHETILADGAWSGMISRCDHTGGHSSVKAKISPIRDINGGIVNYVCVERDVSIEVKLEEQLRQAHKMEAIGTLAGGIAHDFNNILSPIMGFTEMALEDVPRGSLVHTNLKEVLAAAHRAKDLVKQILAFSRKSEVVRRPVLLEPIVREALDFMRATLPATIEIRQTLEVSGACVRADPTQIHQVVMNLCTNAAQAMDTLGGILEVSMDEVEIDPEDVAFDLQVEPGPCIRLSVGDTGCGMGPELMRRIFEPYFTTKEVGSGSGMGLAVVHGIVTACGGDIHVFSRPGLGTRIDVFFPCADGEAFLGEGPPTEVTGPTSGQQVLLVDDERFVRTVMEQFLVRLGYQVTAVGSSLAALEIFRLKPGAFSLAILDQTMPEMTGMHAARELRRIRADLPIILCTGHSDAISREEARQGGFQGYLMKPVVKQDLIRAVRQALDGGF